MSGLAVQTTPVGARPALDLEALAAARDVRPDPGLREAFLASGEPAERQRDRLFDEGALCVTTGQQPGLLLGPLYTVYKALSAVALARTCEERLGRPVVPVFWAAGDDHDFAEANHLHLLTTGNEVERLTLRERPDDAPLTPMYREPVGGEIAAILEQIEAHTPPTEFRADILAWLRRHYTQDTDLATAFAGAVAELLGPYGLVVFRPTHRAAKQAMTPLLLRALEHAASLDDALRRNAAALAAADAPVPVHVGDGATLVMLEGPLGRDRLVLDGDDLVTRRAQERCCVDDVRALAERDPRRLSPNVLLRPVVEAAILPTVAYVAGPGELAYFPQCDPVYERLEVTPQARIARWGGRVLETRVTKVLEKYDITADQLDAPEGQLEQSLVRDAMPPEAEAALAAIRETLGAEYGRLRDAAVSVDPTLKKTVDHARNQALKGTGDVEKRLVSHLKQQNDILVQQLAKARHNLFPLGKPQERVFNPVPYLIRYGTDFLETVHAETEAWMGALEPLSAGP